MKIGLGDIPAGNIYVRPSALLRDQMTSLIRMSGLLLPKDIQDQLYNMRHGQKISLMLLKDLARTFDFPMDFIQANIDLITSVKNTDIGIRYPSLPLNLSTVEGARLIAAIMGDGEFNSNMQIRYNNQDKKLVSDILSCALKIFGDVDYKIYHRPDSTFQLHLPKICGLLLIRLKLRPGRKTITDNNIPVFIFSQPLHVKAAFISQFFSDEGNVRAKDRRVQVKQTNTCSVDKDTAKNHPKTYCPNVLKGLELLLLDFGIGSKISLSSLRNTNADWELSFYGKENLELFRDHIGFYLEHKDMLLKQCILSYRFPSAPRNRRLEWALNKFRIIEKKHGYVTKQMLAEECRRSIKTAQYYLIDMKKAGHIRAAGKQELSRGKYRSIPNKI